MIVTRRGGGGGGGGGGEIGILLSYISVWIQWRNVAKQTVAKKEIIAI